MHRRHVDVAGQETDRAERGKPREIGEGHLAQDQVDHPHVQDAVHAGDELQELQEVPGMHPHADGEIPDHRGQPIENRRMVTFPAGVLGRNDAGAHDHEDRLIMIIERIGGRIRPAEGEAHKGAAKKKRHRPCARPHTHWHPSGAAIRVSPFIACGVPAPARVSRRCGGRRG